MKAVILEIKNGKAAVLLENGEFATVKDQNYHTGDTVSLTRSALRRQTPGFTARRFLRYGSAAAAAMLLLGVGGVRWYTTSLACSYVSLDVNPSIEYVLNRQDQILSVTALNEDAKEIVESLSASGIKYLSLEDVLKKTLALLEENGYTDDAETSYVLINVSSDNEKRSDALKEEISSAFASISDSQESTLSLTLSHSSVSEREKAKDLGISSGEYRQILEIEENEESGQSQDLTEETVRAYADWQVRDLLTASGRLPEDQQDTGAGAESEAAQVQEPSADAPAQENSDGSDRPEAPADSGNTSPADAGAQNGAGNPPDASSGTDTPSGDTSSSPEEAASPDDVNTRQAGEDRPADSGSPSMEGASAPAGNDNGSSPDGPGMSPS